MASRQQIIHVLTEIAVIISITAYFIYRNKVLNERMKSLEYKLYQQEEIIKKHDTILQTLLTSSISKSFENNSVTFHQPNISLSKNPPGDDDDETDTDDDDDDSDNEVDNRRNDSVKIGADISLNNLRNASQEPAIGKVVITLGDLPLPDFGFESFLSPPVNPNEIGVSSKVEEITEKEDGETENKTSNLEDEVDDEEVAKDDSGGSSNSKKKKKKKKNKKKNLTDDELLDLELQKEIQELA